MSDIDIELGELEAFEDELQFDYFSNATALEIGMELIKAAKQEHKSITIDIARNNQQLFHYAFDGTACDNAAWIVKKRNTVNRFGKSTLYMGLKLKKQEKTMEQKYGIDSSLYSFHGGGFPIRLRNTGLIGSICVSGLSQQEDHQLIIKILRQFLNKNI